ncbi:hypothetical protein BGZ67_010531 [Mortierella alpina]|nr:hypothetical protein BGZ67_010531 [Mortierella alpina]
MKCLLRLALATTLLTVLVSAATDQTTTTTSSATQDFLHDPQMQKLAPHFLHHVDQILRQPTQPRTEASVLWTSKLTPIAVLNDMIKIVCLVFAKGNNNNNDDNNKDGNDFLDLSKIEAAKLEAIQLHGEEAVHAAAHFSAYDSEACMALVDTIYDTVGFLQPPGVMMGNTKMEEVPSAFKVLGFGLDQASSFVQTLQSIIVPHLGGCETRDEPYRQGAEAVTYNAAMVYGLAGATIASAPRESAVKALGVGQIIVSVAQLAIGLAMAQNVARLAGLDPEEPAVKTTIYLTLAGEVDSARELNRLRQRAMQGEVPKEWWQRMDQASAEVLVTKGPGQRQTGPPLLASVPVVGNVFAFSDQWLSGNRIGNDVKFVFCPDVQKGEEEVEALLNGGGHAADSDETTRDDGAEEEEEQQQGQVEDPLRVENKLEL